MGDVMQEHRRRAALADRHVLQRVERRRHAVQMDDELLRAQLGVAGGQRQRLGVDRVDHIGGGEAVGAQLVGVEIDHDLAVAAAGGRRQGDAGNRRQGLAHLVQAVIVELLLVQRVRGQAELQHRHAGGVELHHDRRLDAGRHQGPGGVRRRHDLADRQVDVHVRLEVDLCDGEPFQRLALHVPNIADVRADVIFTVGGNALLHLLRRQARILPDHRHHRDVDRRQHIARCHGDGADTEKQGQEGDDIEGVGKAQGEADDTHGLDSSDRAPAPWHRQGRAARPERSRRARSRYRRRRDNRSSAPTNQTISQTRRSEPLDDVLGIGHPCRDRARPRTSTPAPPSGAGPCRFAVTRHICGAVAPPPLCFYPFSHAEDHRGVPAAGAGSKDAGIGKRQNRWVAAGASGATSHRARMAVGSGSSSANMTDMNTWIRLALAASLSIATAPAAMAQCIVSQNAVGTSCAGGIGSRPLIGHSMRPLTRITTPPRLAPFRAMPIPSPRQAQTMGAPNTSLMPNTSLPGGL